MPHIERFFEKKSDIRWFWPLRVGLLDHHRANATIDKMLEYHWAQELSRVHNITLLNPTANVLFFDQGFDEAAQAILNSKVDLRCEVVIIIDNDLDYSDEQALVETLDETILESIAKESRAAGIFVIPSDRPLNDWYNHLIMELSHNQSIVESLRRTIHEGLFYYDPDLEEKTRLSHFVKRLVNTLREVRKVDNIPTDTRLFGDYEFHPRELSDALRSVSDDFQYEHESGEGEPLARLSENVFDVISPEDLDQLGDIEETPEMTGGDPPAADEEEAEAEPDDDSPGVPKRVTNIDDIRRSGKKNGDDQEESDIKPRYLQGQISEEKENYEKPKTKYLAPDTDYFLHIRIGPDEEGWLRGHRTASVERIFEDTSEPQDILIMVRSNCLEEEVSETISLPRNSKSTVATLSFHSKEAGTTVEAEVFAYHQNRLIQSALISAPVLEDPLERADLPPLQMTITSCPRTLLNNLSDRVEFSSSIFYSEDEEAGETLRVVDNHKRVPLNFETAIQSIVKDIKADIEDAVKNIDEYPEDLFHENNQALLLRLALNGNSLYYDYLKQNGDFDGPIQIVSNRAEYIPFDFVYTYPPPDLNATLCPKAVEALKAGKCQECFDRETSPSPHICPFGFWCFSRVIERYNIHNNKDKIEGGYDFTLISEPVDKRATKQILAEALFATTDRIEAATPGLEQQVENSVKNHIPGASIVDNWTDWKTNISNNPDSLILIVHTEENRRVRQSQMEIGDKQFILRNYIDESMVKGSREAKEAPFVIIIGCNTQETDEYGFDFTSRFVNSGASIVVSNFTKIRGRHAGPIVMKLLDLLKKNQGKEIPLGQVILKLRQQLLAKGIMVSLALIAHGDADWKLKI